MSVLLEKPGLLSDEKSFLRHMRRKRMLDLFLGIPGFVAFIPIGLLISLAIFVDDPNGGSPIFLQKRLGKDMKPFRCVKFRTMKGHAPKDLATNSFDNADQYITRLGRILRKTSIDELPQLWNVVMGEMSLVGPRPLVLSETDVHEKRNRQGIYHIKPGITGLAQISGRDLVDDDLKVDLDFKYYKNLSVRNDLRIILGTIAKVVRMENIVNGKSEEKQETISLQENADIHFSSVKVPVNTQNVDSQDIAI